MPDEWPEDKQRCLKAGIPEEKIKFRTNIQLCRELIDQALEQGINFSNVAFDSFYGRGQNLINDLATNGLRVVADVPLDQTVWAKRPDAENRPKNLPATGATRVDRLAFPKLRESS